MTCILIAIQFNNILPGGAAVVVMMQYGIQPMQFSMIMSAPYLSGFLFAILAGVMADRIGLNKILMTGFIAGLIGAILRIFSVGNFALIFIAMIILGFSVAVLNANSAKLLRDWFPGRANSFAMGVYTAGMSLGAAIAIWYGSRLDPMTSTAADLQGIWTVGAVLIAIGIVIWIICYRNHPAMQLNTEPVGQYLKEVLKDPAVWGIALFAFFVFGGSNVNGSYMVAAVTTLAGDPSKAAEAGNLSTINTVVAAVCSMILPGLFASGFKNLRGPVWICAIITALCFGLVYFLPYGTWTWVLYIIQGVAMASLMPFVKMTPTLLPGIKREQLGVVGGVQATFQNVGMFLVASYILSPIAIAVTGTTDGLGYYQAIYVGLAIVFIIAALTMYMFPNVPSSVDRKVALDRAAAEQENKAE
ncbi:MAG: CynX/NimT family MFS transporter [Coriobacteriales bacterium]